MSGPGVLEVVEVVKGVVEVGMEVVMLVKRDEPLSCSVRAGRSVITSGRTGLGSSRENSVETGVLSLGRSGEKYHSVKHTQTRDVRRGLTETELLLSLVSILVRGSYG